MRAALRLGSLAVVCAAAVAGCGAGSPAGEPSTRGVPLAAGARVVFQTRRCDRGPHPYCSLQLVLVGDDGGSSQALLERQQAALRGAGWSFSDGYTPEESAAESRRHDLRLTFATAAADLLSIDQGQIKRAPADGVALARTMFAQAPALSLLLEHGSS